MGCGMKLNRLKMVVTVLGLSLASSTIATAEGVERTFLGFGRLFTNDILGDGHDRWQTGSLQTSRVWGPRRQDILPENMGEILEFRLNFQSVAPWDLTRNDVNDRQYAPALTIGVHTHFKPQNWVFDLGIEASILGPQNGIEAFQNRIHDLVGSDRISPVVSANQAANRVVFGVSSEAYRQIALSEKTTFTPFVETRYGLESYFRVGGDLMIGNIAKRDLAVRDAVSGFKYPTVIHAERGTSVIVGADTAWVETSALFPEGSTVDLTNVRHRVRAGILHKRSKFDGFYGVTWLSPEFDQQPSGQVVGSLRLDFRF